MDQDKHYRRLKVCLAASGGGHIRQMLDLERAWRKYDYFFVSEDSALTRSLVADHSVHLVCHFAFGQAKRNPFKMFTSGLRNFWQSAVLIFKNRPDVVISLGAGSTFFYSILAKLFGAKIILIESFARFLAPSLFWRLLVPFANYRIVQSSSLAKQAPGTRVFDPFEVLPSQPLNKKELVFVTAGATFSFDRMIKLVAELKHRGDIPEEVVIQTGPGGYIPASIETYENLPFEMMKTYLRDANIVICHGGTGSIITALREGCRTIVVPRLPEIGEHYDDHQAEIAESFSKRGLIVSASSLEGLANALKEARLRPQIIATTNHSELVKYLQEVLSGFSKAA